MTTKAEKLPKSAMALYVTLYCKRKNRSETKKYNNFIEASKSWLLLSEHEKLKFFEKYRDFQAKYQKKIANYLRNAQPYMKKRYSKRSSELTKYSHNYKAEKHDNDINYQTLTPERMNESLDEANSQIATQTEEELLPQYYEGTNLTQGCLKTVVSEPIPPSLKTGQDLFEIVNASEDNDLTWSVLTPTQKRRYHNAAISIKKEYLNNYKAYLESLTANDLFKYYNKTSISIE